MLSSPLAFDLRSVLKKLSAVMSVPYTRTSHVSTFLLLLFLKPLACPHHIILACFFKISDDFHLHDTILKCYEGKGLKMSFTFS